MPELRHRASPEAAVQRAVVEALRLVLGRWYIVEHAANETRLHPGIQAGLGVISGAADLIIQGAGFVGRLEVKDAKGRLSPKQVEFRETCRALGIPWAEVRSVDEALGAAVAWGIAARTNDGALSAVPPGAVGAVGHGADHAQRTGAVVAGDLREAQER